MSHNSLSNTHTRNIVWDKLLAEFPVLWNPRELHFRDKHATDQAMLQLLQKCNNMSRIPFTFDSLRKKVDAFHRRRKYQAMLKRRAAKRAPSVDVSQGNSCLSDQCVSSDSAEPADKIQSVEKNPTPHSGPFTIVFHCCGVCGEVKGECSKGTDRSYIANNKTTIAMNNLTTEVDFDTDTTVCQNCDTKLKEMYEFVKLVKSAQDKMKVIIESRDQIPINVDEESDENEDQKLINSLTVTDTELVKPTVSQKRKCEENAEVKKKFKVTIDLDFIDNNIHDDKSTMDDIEAKYQMFQKGEVSLAKSAYEVSKAVTENNEDAILKLKKIIEQDMHKEVNETRDVTDADRRNDIESELTSDGKDENCEDIIVDVKKEMDADDILNEVNELNDVVTLPRCGSVKTNETTSKGESVCGMAKSDLIELIKSIVSQMLNK